MKFVRSILLCLFVCTVSSRTLPLPVSEEQERNEAKEEAVHSIRRYLDPDSGFSIPGYNDNPGQGRGPPKQPPKGGRGPPRVLAKISGEVPEGIIWLMSFPNSGTSFTMHLIRNAANVAVASNYAGEGVPNKPSSMAIDETGPIIVATSDKTTEKQSRLILTKTHCQGYCSSNNCGRSYIHNPRSFMKGCALRTRYVPSEFGDVSTETESYDQALVEKAIHLVRDPLNNIVSRFHNEHGKATVEGDAQFLQKYPRNKLGFQSWCSDIDEDRSLFKTWPVSVDRSLKDSLRGVPCHSEFFKYVQWHNLAFSVTQDMNLPTLIVHYEDYEHDVEGELEKLLQFVEMKRVTNEVYPFSDTNKTYHDHYTLDQVERIFAFVQEYASFQTWNEMKQYVEKSA